MTGTAPGAHDEFVFHGGRRRSLRFWLMVLPVLLVIALIALVSAINQGTSDDSGGAGHVVIPFVLAVVSVLGLVITIAQWWEDETFFTVDGDTLSVRHGSHSLRGRVTHATRSAPVLVTREGIRGNEAVFVTQADTRVRLGDANTAGTLQPANLEAWLRTRGFKVEHHSDGPRA